MHFLFLFLFYLLLYEHHHHNSITDKTWMQWIYIHQIIKKGHYCSPSIDNAVYVTFLCIRVLITELSLLLSYILQSSRKDAIPWTYTIFRTNFNEICLWIEWDWTEIVKFLRCINMFASFQSMKSCVGKQTMQQVHQMLIINHQVINPRCNACLATRTTNDLCFYLLTFFCICIYFVC